MLSITLWLFPVQCVSKLTGVPYSDGELLKCIQHCMQLCAHIFTHNSYHIFSIIVTGLLCVTIKVFYNRFFMHGACPWPIDNRNRYSTSDAYKVRLR